MSTKFKAALDYHLGRVQNNHVHVYLWAIGDRYRAARKICTGCAMTRTSILTNSRIGHFRPEESDMVVELDWANFE